MSASPVADGLAQQQVCHLQQAVYQRQLHHVDALSNMYISNLLLISLLLTPHLLTINIHLAFITLKLQGKTSAVT